MKSSEQIDQLAAALATAQESLPSVPKTHSATIPTKGGGSYGYRYADLADSVAAATPILAANGLSIAQTPEWDGTTDVITTRLMHLSGQWIEGTMRLFLATETPQAHGSAITYGRRYAYCAICGIVADEDDDGAAAQQSAPTTTRHAAPRQADPETGEVRPQASTTALVSEKQLGFMSGLFNAKGFPDDHGVRVAYVKAIIGRDVEKAADMTKAEASQVIDALKAEEDAE